MVSDSISRIYLLRSRTDERNLGQAPAAPGTILVLQMGNPKEWPKACTGNPAEHSDVHAGRYTASHDYEETAF